MVGDNWITESDMHAILANMQTLDKAYQEIKDRAERRGVSVDFFSDHLGWGTTMAIRDSNGDPIGHYGIGEDGHVCMYLENGEQ